MASYCYVRDQDQDELSRVLREISPRRRASGYVGGGEAVRQSVGGGESEIKVRDPPASRITSYICDSLFDLYIETSIWQTMIRAIHCLQYVLYYLQIVPRIVVSDVS